MKHISDIQVLRGLAALGVVVYHAQGELIYRGAPNPLPSLEWGMFGVDLFFVISGFVMTQASAEAFGTARSIPSFAARRVARIVPLYWIATIAFTLLSTMDVTSLSELRGLGRRMVQSMVFLPSLDGMTPILPTGWTLNDEMAFYLCFAAVLPFRRRRALSILTVGLAALGVAGTVGWLPARLAVIANLQVLEFIAGVGLAEAWRAGWRVPRSVGLAVAVVALMVVMAVHLRDPWDPWRAILWGVPAAFAVGGLALAREAPDAAARRSAVRVGLERLGDASYSVYLTHFVVNTSFAYWLFPLALSGPRGAFAYFCILLLADAPACWLVYRFIEKPLTRRLSGRRRRRAAPPTPTRAGGLGQADDPRVLTSRPAG